MATDRKPLMTLMKTFGLKEGQSKPEFAKEMREFRESLTEEELNEFLDLCDESLKD